jgi:hypothetical protein
MAVRTTDRERFVDTILKPTVITHPSARLRGMLTRLALATNRLSNDLEDMAKSLKISRSGSNGKFEARVLGVTKDGVRILKPKGPATHFTQKEVREAVAMARAKR